ncbi:MAG TPA: DUF1080 domain-containing protein [Pirellulaceae bacterium]|nr:DUF1080 domain-containing protein [Pirellulaceae bacterium]HMO90880.1 DUF1080 domain-containing protein [Pirellulaceae bacterium]HMP68644.1 DUF1080 domain-containing protein [Pirellulaceae bacterium]
MRFFEFWRKRFSKFNLGSIVHGYTFHAWGNRAAVLVGLISIWIIAYLSNPLTTAAFTFFPQEESEQAQQDTNKDTDFIEIFNGRSLEGWSGREGNWTVEDGCIVGRTSADNPIDRNTFLIWQGGELKDFELRLQYRIESGNSGIQFRSRDLGNHHVAGYQADIDAENNYTGILYEEQGRGILARRTQKIVRAKDGKSEVAERPTCNEDELLKSFKNSEDGWHDYVVVARGNRIIQQINGLTTIDFDDQEEGKAAKSGILALQLHTGPPMKIAFRNIRLKHLQDE